MPSLFERFRPQTWDQVVAQDGAVNLCRRLVETNAVGGRAYWITGVSGSGKTSIARLLARELADPFCITEVDASDVDTDFLREAERTMHLYGFGSKPGRAWIVNEAHRLPPRIIGKFNSTFEPIPGHVAWIFTTTIEGQEALFEGGIEAPMFLSRCTPIRLSLRNVAEPIARMVQANMASIGMDGHDLNWYVNKVKAHRNNARAVYSECEAIALGA
jgi:hypothetical protein